MPISNYPNGFANGVNIRGIPLLSAYPGDVFWVAPSSLGGSDGNKGTFDRPFATIDYAVGRCTANRGDIIMVKPGHVETVTAAGGLDLDVAGIAIVGLGTGTLQPSILLTTATTADIDIDAANITMHNMHIKSGFADIAVAIDVNSTDFTLSNCRFSENADNENFLICVQDAAAAASSRITIDRCHAIQDDAANTHFVNFAGTGTGHIVTGNTLIGDWGTMAVGGAGVVTFAKVTDNMIFNIATTNDACINFAATATGVCMRNFCGGGAAQANGILATGMAKVENYYTDLSDASGILDPVQT